MGLLETARVELAASGQAAEVVETDAAISQALLEAGDAPAAEDLARDAAARAESLDAAYLLPTLQRVRGAALAEQGRLDGGAGGAGGGAAVLREPRTARARVRAGRAGTRSRGQQGDSAAAARLSVESAAALDDLDFVGSGRYPRN